MGRRKRREWEAEYVSEYCSRHLEADWVKYHFRLGTWPQPHTSTELEEAERRLLRVRMRWADAVAGFPDKILVIEGKLRPSEYLKGLGELQLYTHLVPHTIELKDYWDRTVQGRLIITLPDPTVTWLARAQGLEVATYQPTFWDEYTNVLSGRETRPIRPEESRLLK